MALVEDLFKGSAVTGVAVGVGALLLAPTVLPAIGRVIRPAAKAVIKGGMVFYRETLAEVGEVAGDLFAEARAELEHDNASPGIAGGGKTDGH
jgi:hypothetical protein